MFRQDKDIDPARRYPGSDCSTPRSSARAFINRRGCLYGMPNLFVADGSLFAGSAAPNPTLTIVALAIRQAEHSAETMVIWEL